MHWSCSGTESFEKYQLSFHSASSRGGLEVELWTDNSPPSASVDQISLGAMYLYGAIWTRYIHKVYRPVLYVCVSCKAAYTCNCYV